MTDMQAVWEAYSRVVRGDTGGHRLVDALLAPLEVAGAICGGLHAVRLWSYQIGLRKVRRLPCPVISVGNLTWGGTGKTPAVIMIAQVLKERGIPVAVVSRGYKGATGARVNVVSDGTSVLLDARSAGDEPLLLAERLTGVPVLTCRNRYLAGRYAWSKFQVAGVILDDGFQHLQLARDVNILLLDATNPWGNRKLIPRGMLREPISQAVRADAILLTKCNDPGAQHIASAGAYPSRHIPAFRSTYAPRTLVNLYTNARTDPQTLQGERVYGFCGIAEPRSFEATIRSLGASPVGFRSYRDHHTYTAADIELLEGEATVKGADLILTTGKDGGKVRPLLPAKLPFLQLDIDLKLLDREEEFLNLLLSPFTSRSIGPAGGAEASLPHA